MVPELKSIQFLRFVAAPLVVFHHAIDAVAFSSGQSASPFFQSLSHFGECGVHVFFVISGFIMVYTSFNKSDEFDPKTFLTRRFIRIYPIYWVYALIYMVVQVYLLQMRYGSTAEVVGALALVPGFSWLIIGSGWTLSFEIYFYLCFAVVMIMGLVRGMRWITILFVGSTIIGLIFRPSNALLHYVTNSLLLEFLAGAWIAVTFMRDVRLSSLRSTILIGLAIGLFLGTLPMSYHGVPHALTWGMPSAMLVAGFAFLERNAALPRWLAKLSFLGDSSYSLYLLHMLLMAIVTHTMVAAGFVPQSLLALFITYAILSVISILIAIAAYEVAEIPLTTSMRRLVFKLSSLRRPVHTER